MIDHRSIQELRHDMKNSHGFRGCDLTPRKVREYLATKILNEMVEKPSNKRSRRINEQMDYDRVVPRDFFNEAKLLKCMGVLAVKILDNQLPEGISIEIDEGGDPFQIEMLQEDGSLSVVNYPVTINGEEVIMKTKYNSKDNFPLYCMIDDEDYLVFNESGEFDQDFIKKFSKI